MIKLSLFKDSNKALMMHNKNKIIKSQKIKIN